MTKLKGVAHTFRVTNEDTSAITKTSADYWISGAIYDQFQAEWPLFQIMERLGNN